MDSFSISPYKANSLTFYNNQLYIGTDGNIVLVMADKTVLFSSQVCFNDWVGWLHIDQYGYLEDACVNDFKQVIFIQME